MSLPAVPSAQRIQPAYLPFQYPKCIDMWWTTKFLLTNWEEMYGNQSGEFLSWPWLKSVLTPVAAKDCSSRMIENKKQIKVFSCMLPYFSTLSLTHVPLISNKYTVLTSALCNVIHETASMHYVCQWLVLKTVFLCDGKFCYTCHKLFLSKLYASCR